MQYRVSLVELDQRYGDSKTVGVLDVDGEKRRAIFTTMDQDLSRELEEFAGTLETEGVVLLAESMSDGRGHGPFLVSGRNRRLDPARLVLPSGR